MMQRKFTPGMKVEHLFRGPCTVVRESTTLIGWPTVFVEDANGVVHEVNPKYLKRIDEDERIAAKRAGKPASRAGEGTV